MNLTPTKKHTPAEIGAFAKRCQTWWIEGLLQGHSVKENNILVV